MDTTLIARPDEQLTTHCRRVAERSGEPAGWIHDLPKATQWCQRYLAAAIDETQSDRDLKNHARLAGYVAFYCARQRGLAPVTAYAEAIAIAKHHGNVPNASSYVRDAFPGSERWIDVAHRERARLDLSNPNQVPGSYNTHALVQASDIDADGERHRVGEYLIENATDGAGSWSEFYDCFEAGDLQAEMRQTVIDPIAFVIDEDVFEDGGEWYEELLRVYAAIQFADGTVAGTVPDDAVGAPPLPVGAIDAHLQEIRASAAASPESESESEPTDDLTDALNAIRTAVQDDLLDRLRAGVAEDLQGGGVVRLSLPTGYGKTLSAGLFAEYLLARQSDVDRRVCYALPFTTVADQTATVFKRALAGTDAERAGDKASDEGKEQEGAAGTQGDERRDSGDAAQGRRVSGRAGEEQGREDGDETGDERGSESGETNEATGPNGSDGDSQSESDSGSDSDSVDRDASPDIDPMVLSIDHHRAETPTDRIAEDHDVTTWGAETILSAWRARMTITTIVQLFESVVGPFRSQSRKLPALEGAIVVVDEPQAIPIGWRPLVARAIETLVERDNAIVLLMTATQPFLLGSDSAGSLEASTHSSSNGSESDSENGSAGAGDDSDGGGGDDDDDRESDGNDSAREVIDLVPTAKLAEIERAACKEAGIETVPNRVIYKFHESVLPGTGSTQDGHDPDHDDRDRPSQDGDQGQGQRDQSQDRDRSPDRNRDREETETDDSSDAESEATDEDGGEKEATSPLSHGAAGERVGATFAADREPALVICNTVASTRQLTDALETSLCEAGIEPLTMGRQYDEAIDRDSHESSRDALTADALLETIDADADIGANAGASVDASASAGSSDDTEAATGDDQGGEPGAATVPVFHLTRRVPAAKLATLIQAATTLAERGVPHLVVSTQLVEAGVDISYQRVYRDFAPLDSIVQAAGRCNRSYEWGIDGGRVLVWALEPLDTGPGMDGGGSGDRSKSEDNGETQRSPAEQVYATDRADVSVEMNTLERSRAALEPLVSRAILRETDLQDAVETYHADLSGDLTGVTAADDELLAAYERGDGRTLRFASLIEERFEVDVIVCMTAGDHQLIANLHEHIDTGEWVKATEVRQHLTRLSVAVPVNSFDSDRWRCLAALDQLIPADDGDERVIDLDSELLSARDGIHFDRTDS
jgi:hypothetical protein